MVQFYFQLGVLNRNCFQWDHRHNYTPLACLAEIPTICTSILRREYQRSILFPPWGRIGTPFQYLWCLTDISMGLLGDCSRKMTLERLRYLFSGTSWTSKDPIAHVGASCVLFLRFYDNSEKFGLSRWTFWVWFLKFHGLPSIMSVLGIFPPRLVSPFRTLTIIHDTICK